MPNPISKYGYYIGSIFTLLGKIDHPMQTIQIFLNPAAPTIHEIHLPDLKLVFRVRGRMDIWSVKETLLDRFYERYGTSIQDGWKIIDIGGGIGEFTIFAAAGRPGCQVAAFEPFPASFELLQQNLQLNHLDHVQFFPEAIGASDGSLNLDISGGEPLMIQSGARSDLHSGQTIEVPCISLDTALNRLGFSSVDLLKLDCEGAEYSILMDTPVETLRRIQRIVMEYHNNVGPRQHRQLSAYLTNQGFQVQSVPNAVHDHLGYLYAFRLK